MACTGIHALDPVCHVKSIVSKIGNDAFSKIAQYAGQAAAHGADWLWRQIDDATSVNLADAGIRHDLLITGSIAGVLCVGLFLIQMMTAALRREPGALGRGLQGLLIATIGSSFAIAMTSILLAAVDQLSSGVVQAATGSDLNDLGGKFAIAAGLSAISNPFVLLGVSFIVLLAEVMVWGAMMIRKLLIVVSAVLTPVAFAGGAADISRGWVRRWIEFTAALITSKLILSIILMIGISMLNGAGQNGSGVTQSGTQLLDGALILLLGGFAPWIAIKMVHFVGDSFQTVHTHSTAAKEGAHAAMALPQKAARVSSMAAGGVGAVVSKAGPSTTAGVSATPRLPSPRPGGQPPNDGLSSGQSQQKPAGNQPSMATAAPQGEGR